MRTKTRDKLHICLYLEGKEREIREKGILSLYYIMISNNYYSWDLVVLKYTQTWISNREREREDQI